MNYLLKEGPYMKASGKVTQWHLDFLSNAYISKKLYEKYCFEVDKKYGFTRNEGEVLHHIYLYGGESTAKAIVEQKWISKSQVSKSVEKLAEMGYISTIPDENDRRVIRLKLTDKAMPAVKEFEKATSEFLAQLFCRLNDDEVIELNRLLSKLTGNIKGENEK